MEVIMTKQELLELVQKGYYEVGTHQPLTKRESINMFRREVFSTFEMQDHAKRYEAFELAYRFALNPVYSEPNVEHKIRTINYFEDLINLLK
jgi:hypothetical protein